MFDFHGGALLAYWFVYGMLTGGILMIGFYLLFSKVPAYAPINLTPAPRVRKTAGVLILVRGVEYLFLFFFMPHFGRYFEYGIEWENIEYAFACLEQINDIFLLPILCIFMFTLFQGFTPVKRYHVLWAIIFPLFLLIYAIIYAIIPGGYGWELTLVILPIARSYWFVFACVMFYIFLKYRRLFRKELEANYSSIEYREFEWLGHLVIFLILYLALWAFIYTHDGYKHGLFLVVERVYSFFIAVYIAYHVDKQEQIVWNEDEKGHYADFEKDTTFSDEMEGNEALTKVFEDIEAGLQRLMNEEQLFANPDLSRDMVVRALATNRTYFGKYLTSKNLNFHTFINQYRVEHAISMMEAKDHQYSLSEIAVTCGFRSSENFSRVFKRIKDCSPSQYGGGGKFWL